MKNLTTAFIVLFLLSLGASAQADDQVFESSNGFTLSYSSKFKRLSEKAELTLVYAEALSENSNPVMVLSSRKISSGRTPEQVYQSTAHRLKTQHKATDYVVGTPMTVDGVNFYNATYKRTTPQGTRLSCRTYNFYDSDTGLFVFVLAVQPQESQGSYLADFESVLKTFRLK